MDRTNMYVQEFFSVYGDIYHSEKEIAKELADLQNILPPEQYNEIAYFDNTRRKLIHTISENDVDNRYNDEEKISNDINKYEKMIDELPIYPEHRYILYDLVLYGKDKFNLGNTSFYTTLAKMLTDMPEGVQYDDKILQTLKYAYMHRRSVKKDFCDNVYVMAYEKLTDKKLFPENIKAQIKSIINKNNLDKRNVENRKKLEATSAFLRDNPNLPVVKKIKIYEDAFELCTRSGYSRSQGFMMKSNICLKLSQLYMQNNDIDAGNYYFAQREFWYKTSNKAMQMAKLNKGKNPRRE